MNILYAIQGTGNGHLSRAVDIIPELRKYGKLDLFVSGAQAEITLPYPVKYKSKGLSFYFGKTGGINFLKTFQKNSSKKLSGRSMHSRWKSTIWWSTILRQYLHGHRGRKV